MERAVGDRGMTGSSYHSQCSYCADVGWVVGWLGLVDAAGCEMARANKATATYSHSSICPTGWISLVSVVNVGS